jgi:hypothetical protein
MWRTLAWGPLLVAYAYEAKITDFWLAFHIKIVEFSWRAVVAHRAFWAQGHEADSAAAQGPARPMNG